jgi:hypothetical protein
MNVELRRRLEVLRLRQRVELCSWRIFAACLALPATPVRHTQIDRRLRLLVAWARDEEDFRLLGRTATELGWVYGQCCEVLHGRRAFTELGETLVRGWAATVDAGEDVVAERLGSPHVRTR